MPKVDADAGQKDPQKDRREKLGQGTKDDESDSEESEDENQLDAGGKKKSKKEKVGFRDRKVFC